MLRTAGGLPESRRFLILLLLPMALLPAALPRPAAAAEPWDGPAFAAAPAEIARAAAEVPTGEEGVTVLLSDTRYAYDAAGRETYTQHLVYKIGSASAHESWSTVEESWSPWRQETPRLKARVITPDGAEHLLDPATIAENGEPAESPDMFEDGHVLRAPLPAILPGAVVEQEVVVREKSPFFDGGVAHYQILAALVAVRHARLVVELPAGVPLRWVARQLPEVTSHEELAGGLRRLRFEARDLPPFAGGEPGLPPEMARTPYVGFSTGLSWSDLARRYSEIVDRTLEGADLQPFLRTARIPAPSQLETIGLVLARLHQEVRYTGLELGAGGLLPRTPAETLRRKFGDCKDKAVLLTGLLRALDIPAYVALLYAADDDQDVEESLPGFGIFNHAIVVVPGKPAIWIDPTDPYARLGELPQADQGRLALIAAPSTSGLVRTPAALPSDNRSVETREVYLADLGPARVVETSDYLGGAESSMRAYYTEMPADKLRDSLASYMEEEYDAEELTKLEFSNPKDLSQPFRLRLEADKVSRGITDVAEAAVALFPRDLLSRLPDELLPDEEDEEENADAPPRRTEYVFTQPFQAEVRYRIVPPAGFAPRELPASRERRLGPALLSETYAAGADGVVTATLRFDVGKRRLSAKEFDALRAAAGEISAEDATLVSFEQVGESHLAAGRVREALSEFERLAAAQPKKALPRLRVARALLAGGLGEAARQEAERAIRLEPQLALAHRTLGWILQHDALGRRFGPGYDRAAALAAYRKAKALDPDDSTARADLAILLEHDAHGERYADAKDLAAAIEEYRALRKDLEVDDMDDNLTVALLQAGRLQELRELLGGLGETEQRKTLKVVAAAALDGPDAALRLADRGAATAEARSTLLRNAAQNLMVLRRYPEAAALLDRASRQSPAAAEILALSGVLRRTVRHEDMQISLRNPSGPVRKLFQLMAAGTTDGRALSTLFARRLVQELQENGMSPDEGLSLISSILRRSFRSQNLPLAPALEIGLASFRDEAVGDPAIGYRVRLVNTLGSGPQEVTSFVVPEGGEYRILAMSQGFEQLGVEALERLEQGDLRAARQWLDWAHEALVKASAGDPLTGSPLASLWERGQEAGAEEIRCAAAALALEYKATDERVRTLVSCREAAGDVSRRQALDLALLRAYEKLDRPQESAQAAERLAAAVPASSFGFVARAESLLRLNRDGEARGLVEARLRTAPDDSDALHVLADLEQKAGRYDRREEILRRLVDAGHGGPADLNTLAWMALIRGQVDEQAIADAQRSANLRGYGSYPALHTLAALYAEIGRTGEAYQIILQAMGTKIDEAPSPGDWYVFGRLAEHYGLPDMARVYYERVKKASGEPDALSTYGLAQKRLAALGKVARTGRAGK